MSCYIAKKKNKVLLKFFQYSKTKNCNTVNAFPGDSLQYITVTIEVGK